MFQFFSQQVLFSSFNCSINFRFLYENYIFWFCCPLFANNRCSLVRNQIRTKWRELVSSRAHCVLLGSPAAGSVSLYMCLLVCTQQCHAVAATASLSEANFIAMVCAVFKLYDRHVLHAYTCLCMVYMANCKHRLER